MSHYDVAVIGAGAAGLAAGLTLQAAGKSFIVLEARNRVGGRAHTDTSLGLPFDMGAHWLHAARQNPFREIADRLGVRYNQLASWDNWTLYAGGKEAPPSEVEAASDYFVGVLTRLHDGAPAGPDRPFSDFLDPANRWNPLARKLIAQITSHEAENCSTEDYRRYVEAGGDWPVEDGFGELVERNAAGLPVTLDTPVTHIDWSGREVRLETPRGTITARTIILAVPVNVLIAGAIGFTPGLPADLVQALHDCPMGVFEKVALLLDQPIAGVHHLYSDVVYPGTDPIKTFNFHLNPFGRPMVVSHLAGNTGAAVERLDDAEMQALALEALTEGFGSGIKKHVVKMLRTHWSSDPWTRGAYSHARPGKAAARLKFAEAVGDRILLAGEHCSIPFFSTVHGAHLSGIAAAEKALGLLAP